MRGNDVTLIQRTLEGDQNAFTALVNKYQKWVHTLVWRKIGDFHIAEEITQDVFLKVYKKLSTLKPPEQFPRWLYVITTRHCIAWLRKKRQPTSSLDAMPAPKLEELCYAQYEASRGEATAVERQREIVKQLLQKLPESERTVVTLHYLAEMSCEEISEFLGVSPNTVKSRLHRARKRLETQEYLLHDVLGIFQLPPSVIGNIMDKISRIKPTTPSVSKPWVPWTLSFSATLLVILMMGFGPRTSSRFQQPYSFDTTSEMVVELIDAPIVRELKRKSDARTQFGKGDTPNKNSGIGRQSELLFVAAVQADGANVSVPEPQWIQTKGPGGISSPGLFLASDRMLYLITETGLYQLTKKADAWAFVSSSGPNREFSPVMAERGDTLYVLTPNEVLVSTDRSKTWDSLGEHPEGRAVALAITDAPQERSIQNADMTMYLVLRTEVFRSKDAGKQWEFIGHVLRSDVVPDTAVPDFRIWDACTVDNMLFVGTNRGLFRFTDNWEKLPVPTPQGIKSLAVAESGLYVGTIVGPRQGTDWSPHASVFYSADLGDLWTDITPSTREHPVKLIAAVEVVPVGDTLMLVGSGGVLLSYDHGKTWVDPGRDPDMSGAFPVVALDESNFYRINYYPSEITRSTDGGHSWHPFMTGLVSSNVQNLIAIKDVLYAVTGGKIAKSADGGESWEIVNMSGGGKLLIPRVETTDDALYVSSIGSNRTQLFHLLAEDEALAPVQGIPDFEEDNLYVEWKKRLTEARETNVNVRETEKLWQESLHLIAKEDTTNGGFTLAGETVFMEHRRKLFRWRPGETAWHYTGLEDRGELSPIDGKGLALAVSGNVVYAGKREGDLLQSLDNGDTWNDITENLAFPFAYFKDIVCVGSTLYISTDAGVMRSRDGENWHALTNTDRCPLLMDWIATDGSTLYGVCSSGVYQVDTQINTWQQIAPEMPYTATSLAVDGNTLYVGTEHNGIFRFQRDNW